MMIDSLAEKANAIFNTSDFNPDTIKVKNHRKRVDKIDKTNKVKIGVSGNRFRSAGWPKYTFDLGDKSSYLYRLARNKVDIVDALNSIIEEGISMAKVRGKWSKVGDDAVRSLWTVYIQDTMDKINILFDDDKTRVQQHTIQDKLTGNRVSADLLNRILIDFEKAYRKMWEDKI